MTKRRAISLNGLGRGLAISLALHALVAVALLVSLPAPEVEPLPPEPVIEVSLVEAPEPPEEPEREAVQEPEPEPAEPDQAGQADAPEPAPAPPVQAPPDSAQIVPIPVLRPVVQFGERDAGPRVALDGDGVADAGETEEAGLAPDADAPPPATARQADPDAPSGAKADSVEEPAGIALPEIALPEETLTETALDAAEPDALKNAEDIALQSPDPAPADDPPPPDASPSAVAPAGELAEAERLYSPVLTEDRAAMVAMGDLPRAIRASQLCTTELREQLRRGARPYQPELLPSYGLDSGNVLNVGDAAFRADGVWYDLSFRCTVDDDAFRVSTFAFAVGEAIPRTQWQARGFPDF